MHVKSDMEHADMKCTPDRGEGIEDKERNTETGKGDKTQTPLRGQGTARGEHEGDGESHDGLGKHG